MMGPFTSRVLPQMAALAIAGALAGCLTTPPSSSWATDVYRMRLASLKPGMTTGQIAEIMCAQGPMRNEGNATTYDLTEGYAYTLFFNNDRDRPKEVVLHTPYENHPAGWAKLNPSELAIGAVTSRPAR